MTGLHKWLIAGGCALLLFAAWIALQEHDARIRSEANSAAAAKSIDQLQQQMTQRDRANDVVQAQIVALTAAIKTPQQAAQVIDRIVTVPSVQPSPTVIVPKQDLPAPVVQQLPDAPSYAIETGDKAKAVAKALQACQGTQAQLTTCTADLGDTRKQLTAMTGDRDQWEATAKGGTFWHRAWTITKIVVPVAAGAYAAGRFGK